MHYYHKKQALYFSLIILMCSSILHATKPWTFLVYIAADNNLNEYSTYDIEEMKKIGSNKNVNVCVYLNTKLDGQPKITQKLYIEKGNVVVCGHTDPQDSGSIATFQDALAWVHEDYPSEHIAVVLWNHGSGPLDRRPSFLRGICYDDSTGNFLTDRNVLEALEWACDTYRNGKNIDILACDACLMAHAEWAYTMASCVNYFVASQETIPGDGYGYDLVLSSFSKNAPTPASFARMIVHAYDLEYGNPSSPISRYTLSAMNLAYASKLRNKIDAVAKVLTRLLKKDKKNAVKPALIKSLQDPSCTHFTTYSYVDIYQFFTNILKNVSSMELTSTDYTTLSNTIDKALVVIRNCVMTKVEGATFNGLSGMSIYAPYFNFHPAYENTYWSEHTMWALFLKTFINK